MALDTIEGIRVVLLHLILFQQSMNGNREGGGVYKTS